MSVQIKLDNIKMSGKTSILSNPKIGTNGEDISIEMSYIEVNGRAVILKDLQIGSIVQELQYKMQEMDENSKELPDLRALVAEERESCYGDRSRVLKHIKQHMAQFGEGVLAGIIANQIR